jgi:hypothetical protein
VPGSGPECRRSPGSACWCSFAAVETSDWSPSAAEAQCRHAQIPAALRPLCVRGRTWQQNLRRARIGLIGASASARSCRIEGVEHEHIYVSPGMFIRGPEADRVRKVERCNVAVFCPEARQSMVIDPHWWALVSVRMLVRGRLPLSHCAELGESGHTAP